MKTVFVSGATGFVGSHLIDYLLTMDDIEVHGLLRWRSPLDNIAHCVDKVNLHYGDLEDLPSLQKIIKDVKPDYVFHLGAQSYVPYSFGVPVGTLQTNCIGTCNLLEAIKNVKEVCDPVVHICSSSEVYGQVKEDEIPITENNPLRPCSPYAVSKVCEDMLGLQYWLAYGIKTIRTRMFTHTGERRGSVFVLSNFAKQIAQIEDGLQEPVVYVGNLDSVRTFADVKDTVRAYWLLVNKCEYGEVYNIGGNVTMTIREMLNKLMVLSTWENIEIEVDTERLRPADVTLQIPCIDKFVSKTGWKPIIPFEKTLQDTLDYWREKI